MKASGMNQVFFTNSGTEAIEGAIKVGQKIRHIKRTGCTDHEIIAMEHSFHGRSMGALSVTGNRPLSGADLRPLIGGIKFAEVTTIWTV